MEAMFEALVLKSLLGNNNRDLVLKEDIQLLYCQATVNEQLLLISRTAVAEMTRRIVCCRSRYCT